MLRKLIIAATIALLSIAYAYPHDLWINWGGYKGTDGVHCCGENDCQVISPDNVRALPDGYHITFKQVVGGKEGAYTEIVPYSEATPSEDGKYWRCHKPDGERRCFFDGAKGS